MSWFAKFVRDYFKSVKMSNRISEHISFNEATRSQTATRKDIINTPSSEQISAMKNVARLCFEPLRKWYGKPIMISSFFRNAELNIAVGGSKSSEHPLGYCIDMDTDSDNRMLFDWCAKNLKFDQLVWEFGGKWVHISYRTKGVNRNQILDARVINGITKYIDITDK